MNDFHEAVELFEKSEEEFKLIYGENPDMKFPHLIVLDSSFNPPHLGHLHLVKEALKFYDDEKIPVLLLLSINNVDKKRVPASFQNRVRMMALMANHMEEEGIKVNIGLTNKARFADKATFVRNMLCSTVIFLVGFDTIIRIFDPKYYEPETVFEALSECMSYSEFFCLTREIEGLPFGSQVSFIDSIKSGEMHSIPSWWAKKIHLVKNDEKMTSLSSSLVRKMVLDNCDVSSLLIKSIHKYIGDTNSIFG